MADNKEVDEFLDNFKEMNSMDDFFKLQNYIANKKSFFLFRGQSNFEWNLESSWTRELKNKLNEEVEKELKEKNKELVNAKNAFIDKLKKELDDAKKEENKSIQTKSVLIEEKTIKDLEEEIKKIEAEVAILLENIRRWISNIFAKYNYTEKIRENFKYKNYDELAILSTLQHSKDVSTPLIDFTDDFLLAIWFTVSNSIFNNDASLFIFEYSKDEIKKAIDDHATSNEHLKDNSNTPNFDGVFKSPNVSSRALAQRSYFIFDGHNIKEKFKIKEIKISKGILPNLFVFLQFKNKNYKSIFPDLKGEYLNVVSSSDSLSRAKGHSYCWMFDLGRPNNAEEYLNKAIQCFKKAIKINPNNNMNYFDEGLVHFDKAIYLEKHHGEYNKVIQTFDKAIQCFKEAIRINSNNDQHYRAKGNAHCIKANYLLSKNPDEAIVCYKNAIKCYKKAIEINPNNHNNYFELIECCFIVMHYVFKIEQIKYHDLAINYCEKAKIKCPDWSSTFEMEKQKIQREFKLLQNENKQI